MINNFPNLGEKTVCVLKKVSKSKASNYIENHIQAHHKLLKTSYKQKILKAATKKMTQENSRLMMGDFSSNSEEQKKMEWCLKALEEATGRNEEH